MDKAKTKSAIYQELADKSGLTRKQVASLFDALGGLVKRELGKKGPGMITIPAGLVKIERKRKPATKERMGRNPQTGEPMLIKAKPERTVVRARPLKVLKEMIK